MRVRLSFNLHPDTAQAIADRIWDRGRTGKPTAAEIRDWMFRLIDDEICDIVRIAECVRRDCETTDDDHDHDA